MARFKFLGLLIIFPFIMTCQMINLAVNTVPEKNEALIGVPLVLEIPAIRNPVQKSITKIDWKSFVSSINEYLDWNKIEQETVQNLVDYYNKFHLTSYSIPAVENSRKKILFNAAAPVQKNLFPWELPKTKLRSFQYLQNQDIKLEPEMVRNYFYFDQRRYDNIAYRKGFVNTYGCIPVSVAISLSNLSANEIYYVEDIIKWTEGKFQSMDFFMRKIGALGYSAEFTMNKKHVLYRLRMAAKKSEQIMVITYGEKNGDWLKIFSPASPVQSAICQPFYSDGHVIVISNLLEDDGQQFLFTLDPNDPNNNRYWDSKTVFDGAILFYIIKKIDVSTV